MVLGLLSKREGGSLLHPNVLGFGQCTCALPMIVPPWFTSTAFQAKIFPASFWASFTQQSQARNARGASQP